MNLSRKIKLRKLPVVAAILVIATIAGWTTLGLSVQKRQSAVRVTQIKMDEISALKADLARYDRDVWRARADRLTQETQRRPEAEASDLAAETKPLETYLEIVRFIEKARQAAAENRVRLKANEAFGFGSFRDQPPAAAQAKLLRDYLQLSETILAAVLTSGADSLAGMWRAGDGSRSGASASRVADPADLFIWEMPPLETAPRANAPIAIKTQFFGQTAALQWTVNRLHAAPLGLMVRSVAAEPVAEERTRAAKPEDANARAGMSRTGLIRFTLVVELVPGLEASSDVAAWRKDDDGAKPQASRGLCLFGYRRALAGGGDSRAGDVGTPSALAPAIAFGLTLERLERCPYPLQLAGYFGEPGNFTVALAAQDAPENILTRVGESTPVQGCTLTDFFVEHGRTGESHHGPPTEVVAKARLRENATGREVILSSNEPALSETDYFAYLIDLGAPQTTRKTRVGERWSAGESIYRLDRIETDPVRVVVSRLSAANEVQQTHILSLRSSAEEAVALSTTPPEPVAAERDVSVSHESSY